MRENKGYNIPEKTDLKIKGINIPFGDTLMLKINETTLFDTGIKPSSVYNMTDGEFNNLVYERAKAFIDATSKN